MRKGLGTIGLALVGKLSYDGFNKYSEPIPHLLSSQRSKSYNVVNHIMW